jgi:Lamin Tail Domain
MIRAGVFIVLAVLAGMMPFTVHAAGNSLTISEIMYNPAGANTGRQWVEVVNVSPDPIDLGAKTIRLFAGGGNHVIKAGNGMGTSLASEGVAVIADNPMAFLADWPNFTGMLLKSSFSLTSSGTLGILDGDTSLASVTYSSALGAKDDGNSLQHSPANSLFVSGAPTPGVYAAKIPAPLIKPVKPTATKSSTNKGRTTQTSKSPRTSTNSNGYGKGTIAPAESAEALSAGALQSFSIPYPSAIAAIMSSVWFACFLAVLVLSGFSIIMLQRHYP